MKRHRHPFSLRRLPGVLLMALILTSRFSAADPSPTLADVLDPIRVKYNLPSLAGTIFTTDKVVEMAAVGVRKAGTTIPVTTDDLWHLGSDTKTMTAMLAGTFVAEKKLSWNDKIISFFPEIADVVPETTRNITIAQVLGHQAGLKENLDWHMLCQAGSLTDQRKEAAHLALMMPAYMPGGYHYANTDYVVIGAILEKIGGKPWEDLIRERIFKPFGMKSVGFGAVSSDPQIGEPWAHKPDGVPVDGNTPYADNPELVGPAGTVHCTMKDWTLFLSDQLRGGMGEKALLPLSIYQAMQAPLPHSPFGYGYGWIVTQRKWAGGKVLTHTGTNSLNFAVCWLAPAKKFGVLICANEGGETVRTACDDAANAMILRYLATIKTASNP